MGAPLSRRRLLGAALAVLGLLARARPAAAGGARAPHLLGLRVRNRRRPYVGDRPLFATVSPGVKGRDEAVLRFGLVRRARVRVEALRTARRSAKPVWSRELRLPAGEHELSWVPEPTLGVGSYVVRLTVEDTRGLRRVYGGRRPATADKSKAPVVRVLGIEAAPEQRSYAAGETMRLTVTADTPSLVVQVLHCGTELEYTDRIDEMRGNAVTEPLLLDWRANRGVPATLALPVGPWTSGVYAVRLEAPDGRLGFAPVIVRPPKLGTVREAVVLPTNTWQAYNFYDADGDGWGDTWYAGGSPPVDLRRPYRDRGVPPRWRRYDVGFQKWLRWTGRTPDQLAEDDLEAFASGDDLRRLYDLVVFPGHSEYVTERAYDVLGRFRDLGGRLIFLSANNIFWRVDKRGPLMRRVRLWRNLGRPESGLLGVQYRANDDGSRQGPYTVVNADDAPWLWEGTGLGTGSQLGETVGGYGIEIDMTAPTSPPETKVLARVQDLFGPGLHGEMSYYETPAGARVFSAGTLDFGGTVQLWPMRRVLDNLWRHMLRDVPAPPPPPAA